MLIWMLNILWIPPCYHGFSTIVEFYLLRRVENCIPHPVFGVLSWGFSTRSSAERRIIHKVDQRRMQLKFPPPGYLPTGTSEFFHFSLLIFRCYWISRTPRIFYFPLQVQGKNPCSTRAKNAKNAKIRAIFVTREAALAL